MPDQANGSKKESLPRISRFSSPCGDEAYITLEVQKGDDAGDDFRSLLNQYSSYLSHHGLSNDTEVYIRFYLSDITNEASVLRQHLEEQHSATFYSLIGQPPATGSRVSMEAYHISSDPHVLKKESSGNELLINHGDYTSLWMKTAAENSRSPEQQTKELFTGLSKKLGLQGARIKDNVMRTWCYVTDIYKNYNGFVKARMEYFESIGMTNDTHTITSTGIEASHESSDNIIYIDSLALLGLNPDQIDYLSALDNMPSTFKYNVTFERGTKITYGDRTHFYISGTASIDKEGNVLYPGNFMKQTSRALENIQSLLTPHGADLSDMKLFIIYLRDDMVNEQINEIISQAIPNGIPRIIVRANVCRKAWLIEIEGIAITKNSTEGFAPFCKGRS